ncbi:MAG: helix-turn-helix domain-containing protein [Candidatus Zixiibacteriota bacterium]|nr:MAG: helix-turn-helix domain-containing protein [candidate division Zixibacteria bacterium]
MRRNQRSSPPTQQLLSTGEAAALCSVTPDTVLKWIRAGRVEAHRTPGGHHRIPRVALKKMLDTDTRHARDSSGEGSFQYCWEFKSRSGAIPKGCRQCVVYRSRTHRCYEMTTLPAEAGHVGLFCKGTCDECDYYRLVLGQRPNVLVVTDRERMRTSLERDTGKPSDFNLQFADCEYRCSMLVEQFRPDYVVIDCSLGTSRSREFATQLNRDPRIPFVRVILVGNGRQLPGECDKLVFATVRHRFDVNTLNELIGGNRL